MGAEPKGRSTLGGSGRISHITLGGSARTPVISDARLSTMLARKTGLTRGLEGIDPTNFIITKKEEKSLAYGVNQQALKCHHRSGEKTNESQYTKIGNSKSSSQDIKRATERVRSCHRPRHRGPPLYPPWVTTS